MGVALEEFSEFQINFIWIYLFFIGIIGTIANGTVLLLYIMTKGLRTPMNTLFISLCVGDGLVSLFGTFVSSIFVMTRTVMNPAIGNFYGFITFYAGTADAFALVNIAVERYFTVARPFGIGNINFGRVKIELALVWGFSLIWAVGPLVGFSEYTNEGAGFWTSIGWEKANLSTIIYIYAIFFSDYIIPIVIIVFCYGTVVQKVKEVAKTGASESTLKAERAVTNQTIAMVGAYMVAWTPYAIVCMGVVFFNTNLLGPKAAMAPAMFAKLSFMVNPFIYIAMNKQFRVAFITTILRGKDPFAKKDKGIETDDTKTVGLSTTKTAAQAPQGIVNQGADLAEEKTGPSLGQQTAKVSPEA